MPYTRSISFVSFPYSNKTLETKENMNIHLIKDIEEKNDKYIISWFYDPLAMSWNESNINRVKILSCIINWNGARTLNKNKGTEDNFIHIL